MGKISRRQFIGRGIALGALGAAGCTQNRSVVARNVGRPGDRITMGLIGCGAMGTFDLSVFLEQPGVQFVAVCDVDAGRRMQGKKRVDDHYGTNDCVAYLDFRELLIRDDIDAVLIATPDHWHAFLSIAAAQQGKDVYCEKPMSLTVREGRIVADAITRTGVVYQSGTQRRSVPCFRYAVDTARSGKLGRIHTVHTYLEKGKEIGPQPEEEVPEWFDYDRWLGQAPYKPYNKLRCHTNFRWIYDYSGGQLTDIGVHFNDLAQWGLDRDAAAPVHFEGRADFPKAGLFDTPVNFHVSCEYADGVRLEMHDGTPRAVRFEGDAGWIMVDDSGLLTASPESLLEDADVAIESWRAIAYHQADFLEAVRTRGNTIAPPEVAHRSASICHLANLCLRTGESFEWDPERERLRGSDAAKALLTRPQRAPWDLDNWDGKSSLLARMA